MAGRGLTAVEQLMRWTKSSDPAYLKRLALRYAAERLERAGEHGTSDCVRLLRQMADDQ